MKISTKIDDVIWEIEINQNYKHKSDFISWERFAGPLLNFKEHIFPDHVYDTMKKLKPGFKVIKKIDNDNEGIIITNKPVLPEHVIIELAKIFSANPYFPIDIKLLNTETKQKYHIHFKKDGSSTIQWTHKEDQNNLPDPIPDPSPVHDRHWL